MPKTIENLQEALGALSKLLNSESAKVEGAPKPPGEDGPTPNGLWRDVKRDLSDIPRGERWIVRKKGQGRGNKPIKGVPNYIAICLPVETAIVGWSQSQIEVNRTLDARQYDLLNKFKEFLDFREEALSGIQTLQKQTMSLIGDSINHANSAGSNAGLISELSRAQADLLDDLHESKADNNTAKGILHILNRIVSYVQLRKIKNWDELQKVPALREDVEAFFKWRDERDAPPPGDSPTGDN
jgi:hypothetical protein